MRVISIWDEYRLTDAYGIAVAKLRKWHVKMHFL